MKPTVLLLSTVHPATDPRIVYKIAPSLAPFYNVICGISGKADRAKNQNIRFVSLPFFRNLLVRILFCHPVLLWKCLLFRPSIVHIFVPELIPAAFLFKILGAKVVYEVQENLYKKFPIKRYNKAIIYRSLFKFFDKLARKKFHCVFTEDAYLKEYKNLPLPHAVIHNYVSLPLIDAHAERERFVKYPPVFFYSGVISMERSFDTLIEALAILKIKYSEFHVHLFGKVQFDWDEARRLPYFENVEQHLTFHGYTDLLEGIRYSSGATAGIALLKPVADYADSYTTKLFEYMALNLPVITSDFPLYRQVVESSACGFCISPYDSDVLAKTFEWLIENKEAAKTMGQKGRIAAENNYNWVSEERILLHFYKNLFKIQKNRILTT